MRTLLNTIHYNCMFIQLRLKNSTYTCARCLPLELVKGCSGYSLLSGRPQSLGHPEARIHVQLVDYLGLWGAWCMYVYMFICLQVLCTYRNSCVCVCVCVVCVCVCVFIRNSVWNVCQSSTSMPDVLDWSQKLMICVKKVWLEFQRDKYSHVPTSMWHKISLSLSLSLSLKTWALAATSHQEARNHMCQQAFSTRSLSLSLSLSLLSQNVSFDSDFAPRSTKSHVPTSIRHKISLSLSLISKRELWQRLSTNKHSAQDLSLSLCLPPSLSLSLSLSHMLKTWALAATYQDARTRTCQRATWRCPRRRANPYGEGAGTCRQAAGCVCMYVSVGQMPALLQSTYTCICT